MSLPFSSDSSHDLVVSSKILFDSVPSALSLLLLDSLFPDQSQLVKDLYSEKPYLGILCFFFFFLTSFTIMNMVVGVMCEVIAGVAKERDENLLYEQLSSKLQEVCDDIDTNGDGFISAEELAHIFDHEATLELLEKIGVDVYALIDDIGSVFEHRKGSPEGLRFDTFADVLWQYRPTLASSIRCVSSFRSMAFTKLCDMEDRCQYIEETVQSIMDKSGPEVVHRVTGVADDSDGL